MAPTSSVQRHRRIAARLHVVLGVLELIFLVPAVVFLWSLAGRGSRSPEASELVFVGLVTALIPGLQILAGLRCLRGSRAARWCLAVVSVLIGLGFGFVLTSIFSPIGALVGGYSAWALLRDDPPIPATPAADAA